MIHKTVSDLHVWACIYVRTSPQYSSIDPVAYGGNGLTLSTLSGAGDVCIVVIIVAGLATNTEEPRCMGREIGGKGGKE